MLVLERNRTKNTILIGHDIKVTLLSLGRTRAKLGIDAPPEMPVWREELRPPVAPIENCDSSEAGFRVLVVEDDPGHAKLIKLALTRLPSTEVTVVSSGKGATQLLGTYEGEDALTPSLVLLDLHLPDSSGLDVLCFIRSSNALQETPVVMLSCEKNDTVVKRCLDAGANAFVSKEASYEKFNKSIFRIADFWSHTRHVA